MKTTLKKKLTAAILAGCSTFILSGVALANPPQLPPPPSRPFVHNEEVQNYCTQFESDYLGCIYLLVKMLQKILCL